MFNFLKKKKQVVGASAHFKITGMHCTSCSMNIDGELEDLDGVIEATTSYPKSQTEVRYDDKKISQAELQKVIADLGYEVVAQ